MSKQDLQNRISSITQDVGKAGLHALFPNDFEYYAITLELTDSKGNTVDYLTFPVNPESIDYNETSFVNIKKSLGGISALDTDTFIPKKYTISGTFGRKLRLLISNAETATNTNSTSKGVYEKLQQGLQVRTSLLSAKLKTGYGSLKLLESLLKKSSGLDQYNQPMRLFLYNPTLNHNFLVKNESLAIHQDRDTSNMLHKYTINLTAITPIDRLKFNQNTPSSLLKVTSMAALNKSVNGLSKVIKNSVL